MVDNVSVVVVNNIHNKQFGGYRLIASKKKLKLNV